MPNDFLEKTLEDIIYENKNIIHHRGLPKLKQYCYRQVILPSNKRIDILGIEIRNGNLHCDIYELKKQTINADAICQAFNYYTELKCLTKNHFSTFSAKIIMVGRKYEPVLIIDSLPTPIEVYGYEYHMDGISFFELKNSYEYSAPHQSFAHGLWAFGWHGLSYRQPQTSISFHAAYENYLKAQPEFESTIKGYIDLHTKAPEPLVKIKDREIEDAIMVNEEEEKIKVLKSKMIKTEIFPEQPAWTVEFASQIPYTDDIMEDLEIDDCDFEDDELELDYADFETNCEDEGWEESDNNESITVSEKEYRKCLFMNDLKFISIIEKP